MISELLGEFALLNDPDFIAVSVSVTGLMLPRRSASLAAAFGGKAGAHCDRWWAV
jgi:hypothetical protein